MHYLPNLAEDGERAVNDARHRRQGTSDALRRRYAGVVPARLLYVRADDREQLPPQRLAGDEERAFVGLDMAHLLLVDARAFAVNFHESWDVLQSQFPSLSRIIQSLPQETSTPSFTTP